MLLMTSRSISSTENNKAFRYDCDAPAASSGYISSDKNDESQHETPRVTNTSAHSHPSWALEATVSNEKVELLRVNVLYLEGIASPRIPSARVSVWVGFRSSFPPESMTVQSSSYSSYFLKEGNLLAIESDQVKWTPAHDGNDNSNSYCYSSGYHGVAFWDSFHSARSPHLEIAIPPLTSHIKLENQPHLLPDILEFHVCVVFETAAISPVNHDTVAKNRTWRRFNSRTHPSMPFDTWDDPMEEEHWYKDDEGDISTSDEIHITHFSQEQQYPHGVAHLKVPRDPEKTDDLEFSGKILQLPIRVIHPPQSRNERGKENTGDDKIVLQQSATLSIQVEKTSVPANMKSNDSVDDQRHYVISTWNGGNELFPNYAPNSVKCDDDDSEEDEQRNVSPARHFHYNKIKGIITSRSKSKSDKLFEQQVTHDSLLVDQGMCKIQQALESSIKAMSDQRGLAVALRRQRETDPVSPGKSSICGEVNIGELNQTLLEELFPHAQRESVRPKSTKAADEYLNLSILLDGSDDGLTVDKTHSSAHLNSSIATALPKQASDLGAQKPMGQVSSTRKISVMQRLFCGASMELAEVVHHCDEDHLGIYAMDSQLVGSSIDS